jgi:hypothetical protein
MVYYKVVIEFTEDTDKGPKARREEFVVPAYSCMEAITNASSRFGSSLEVYEVVSVVKTKIKGAYEEPEGNEVSVS